METIDNTYNTGNVLTAEQKEQFKNSGTWMKTYSLILMIFLGLGLLIFLLVFGMAGDKLYTEIAKELKKENRAALRLFEELWPIAKLLISIALVIAIVQFVSLLQLFKSGNSFKNVSFSNDSSLLINGFKSFKKFWMISGVLAIVSILLAIGIVIKLFPIIMEAAKNAR